MSKSIDFLQIIGKDRVSIGALEKSYLETLSIVDSSQISELFTNYYSTPRFSNDHFAHATSSEALVEIIKDKKIIAGGKSHFGEGSRALIFDRRNFTSFFHKNDPLVDYFVNLFARFSSNNKSTDSLIIDNLYPSQLELINWNEIIARAFFPELAVLRVMKSLNSSKNDFSKEEVDEGFRIWKDYSLNRDHYKSYRDEKLSIDALKILKNQLRKNQNELISIRYKQKTFKQPTDIMKLIFYTSENLEEKMLDILNLAYKYIKQFKLSHNEEISDLRIETLNTLLEKVLFNENLISKRLLSNGTDLKKEFFEKLENQWPVIIVCKLDSKYGYYNDGHMQMEFRTENDIPLDEITEIHVPFAKMNEISAMINNGVEIWPLELFGIKHRIIKNLFENENINLRV